MGGLKPGDELTVRVQCRPPSRSSCDMRTMHTTMIGNSHDVTPVLLPFHRMGHGATICLPVPISLLSRHHHRRPGHGPSQARGLLAEWPCSSDAGGKGYPRGSSQHRIEKGGGECPVLSYMAQTRSATSAHDNKIYTLRKK